MVLQNSRSKVTPPKFQISSFTHSQKINEYILIAQTLSEALSSPVTK
jgi:hypothetical protein